MLVSLFVAPTLFALARRRKRLAWWGTVEQVQVASGETCRLEDLFRLDQADVAAVENGVSAHVRAV